MNLYELRKAPGQGYIPYSNPQGDLRYLDINSTEGRRILLEALQGDPTFNDIYGMPISLDAFARARVSNPATLFDSKLVLDNQPLFWDDQEVSGTSTSSTHQAAKSQVRLRVDAGFAGNRTRQTFRRFNYQPGKSQLVIMTGVLGTADTGVVKRLGLFDDNNGIYIEHNETDTRLVIRTYYTGSPVDTNYATQDDWNLDAMDGSGPSGVTLDFEQAQIFFWDFEWLGVGRVRCGFFVAGVPIYVHEFLNANLNPGVYMTTPNLPLRWEIVSDGRGTGNSDLLQICGTVVSEGGQTERGVTRTASRGASTFTTGNNASWYSLIGIRLKSDDASGGTTVLPVDLSVICGTTSDFEVALWINPSVAQTDQASWTSVTNSPVEYDVSRDNTNTLSGGTVLWSRLLTSTTQVDMNLDFTTSDFYSIGSAIDGTRDELVFAVRRLTGTTESFLANITWRELI